MSKSVLQLMRGLDLHEPSESALLNILERELTVLGPSDAERELVQVAFHLAFWSHENAPLRNSGEAYIFHPWRAAIRMVRVQYHIGMKDIQVIIDILLHDSIEDAKKVGLDPIDVHDKIRTKLGPDITRDVLHLTQMSHLGETDDEFFIRMLSSRDWRPIAAKFSERTDNIQTIWSMPPVKQKAKIKETERWLTLLFTILKTSVKRDIPQHEKLPEVLHRELQRALRKEKKRLKIK